MINRASKLLLFIDEHYKITNKKNSVQITVSSCFKFNFQEPTGLLRPDFNYTGFGTIKNAARSNNFVLSVKPWIKQTNSSAFITNSSLWIYNFIPSHQTIADKNSHLPPLKVKSRPHVSIFSNFVKETIFTIMKITVQNTEINIVKVNGEDYICLTDMLRAKDGDFFITDWLRNRNTFLLPYHVGRPDGRPFPPVRLIFFCNIYCFSLPSFGICTIPQNRIEPIQGPDTLERATRSSVQSNGSLLVNLKFHLHYLLSRLFPDTARLFWSTVLFSSLITSGKGSAILLFFCLLFFRSGHLFRRHSDRSQSWLKFHLPIGPFLHFQRLLCVSFLLVILYYNISFYLSIVFWKFLYYF